MRVVAIGAGHDDAPPLPAVEPLAVSAAGPRVGLREVALRAKPVALVQRARSPLLSTELLDVLGRVTGGADGAASRPGAPA